MPSGSEQRLIPTDIRRELAYMLHLGKKAEIQILCGESGNQLVEYVVSRLQVI